MQTPKQHRALAVAYLRTFGWLREGKATDPEVAAAVRRFQRWSGRLKADGYAGPKTASVMRMPRCGCSDRLRVRVGRKKASRNPWDVGVIRWGFSSYLPTRAISQNDQVELFAAAAASWQDVCGVRFAYVANIKGGSSHLEVMAGSGRRWQLDGSGGTLAYTYLRTGYKPPIPLVFDADEPFTSSARNAGVYYLAVAGHELGHCAIDLDHSSPDDRINSLMDPFYRASLVAPQAEDIERSRQVWGNPAAPAPAAPDEYLLRVRGELTVDGHVVTKAP